jgi:uncharacterized membrane protein (DUF106 family)
MDRTMSKIEAPASVSDLPLAIIKNMITLATSGFGVVVALAWNEVIKKAVTDFIDPILGKNSGIISLLVYAVVMTILAVLVTMQLVYMQRNLELITQMVQQKTQALRQSPPKTTKKTASTKKRNQQ